MSSNLNGSGNGHDPDGFGAEEDENVVSFPKGGRKSVKPPKPSREPREPQEPMFNLPPTTATLMGVLTICYLLLEAIGYFDLNLRYASYEFLGFIPGAFTGATEFSYYHPLGLFFYVFLHGSWMHFLMNVVMLAAFGAGLERFIGGRRMVEIFFISSLAGIVAHFMIYSSSLLPVIGASGGISGIFGASIIILNQRGMLGAGRNGIWPFVFLWVAISVIFGLFGGHLAGGAQIAWVAHLGGFFAGLLAARRL